MKIFGLTPDAVLARSGSAPTAPPRSPALSMLYGGLSFAAVSVVAYSIWAYQWIQGTAAMYSAIAAVYVGLTGIALGRLVAGRGTAARFALLFGVAFLGYAIVWCAFWFGLKGKHHADLFGSAVGLAGMTWLVARAFGQREGLLPVFGVLFTCHTLGYFLGDELYAAVRGSTGRLLWGAAHGAGFGAGLGYVLCHAQLRARSAASAAEPRP
jgi:hypothetical protein